MLLDFLLMNKQHAKFLIGIRCVVNLAYLNIQNNILEVTHQLSIWSYGEFLHLAISTRILAVCGKVLDSLSANMVASLERSE